MVKLALTWHSEPSVCVGTRKNIRSAIDTCLHTLIDLSSEAVARNWPSAEKVHTSNWSCVSFKFRGFPSPGNK